MLLAVRQFFPSTSSQSNNPILVAGLNSLYFQSQSVASRVTLSQIIASEPSNWMP